MRLPIFLFTLLAALALGSCQHTKESDPEPPLCTLPLACYAGTVIGDACLDGVIIEVDAAYPIGKPVGTRSNNVIAAVNFADFGTLNQVGQRVYFTFTTDPGRQLAHRACTANTAPLPVPHLVLGNLATTPCVGMPR